MIAQGARRALLIASVHPKALTWPQATGFFTNPRSTFVNALNADCITRARHFLRASFPTTIGAWLLTNGTRRVFFQPNAQRQATSICAWAQSPAKETLRHFFLRTKVFYGVLRCVVVCCGVLRCFAGALTRPALRIPSGRPTAASAARQMSRLAAPLAL